jgi:hypothetical protein
MEHPGSEATDIIMEMKVRYCEVYFRQFTFARTRFNGNYTEGGVGAMHDGSRKAINMLSLLGLISDIIQRVLTIVYNTQNQWVCGLHPSSGILNN